MPKDLGDIVARSIIRHAGLALLTGGVGNIFAAAGDVIDVMDAMDVTDAMDTCDATDTYTSQSTGDGQAHFGSSQDVNTTSGPANYDDHGIVTTIPQNGTEMPRIPSTNDTVKS